MQQKRKKRKKGEREAKRREEREERGKQEGEKEGRNEGKKKETSLVMRIRCGVLVLSTTSINLRHKTKLTNRGKIQVMGIHF